MLRRLLMMGVVIVALAGPVPLSAQQSPAPAPMAQPVYLFGGANVSPETKATYGVTVGIGAPLTKTVNFEVSVSRRTSGAPQIWGLTVFTTSNTYERIRRDMPLVFALRFSPLPKPGVRTAFVLGGGFNLREDKNYLIATCPSVGLGPCTSVPRSDGDSESFMEPTVVVGLDIVVPLGGRFEFVPSGKLFGLFRGHCNSGGRACASEPEKPGPFRAEAGVKLNVLLK